MVLYLQQIHHQAVISHQNWSKRFGVIFTTRYRRWFSVVCVIVSLSLNRWLTVPVYEQHPLTIYTNIYTITRKTNHLLCHYLLTLFSSLRGVCFTGSKVLQLPALPSPLAVGGWCELVGWQAGGRERDRAVKQNRNWRLKKEKRHMHYFL